MNKKIICICIVAIVIEIVAGCFILGKRIKAIKNECPCESPRAQDLELALFRNLDEDMPRCDDEPMCWERIGKNKYTGDDMYVCGVCNNTFEMIPDGNDFVKLIFISDEEWLERKSKWY